ncbi:MAG: S-formylglutathione hydrolase [Alphaproteobacteria bacterium]
MPEAPETISEQKCFGGIAGFYRHPSSVCGTDMRFAVYQPPQARERRVPVVFYLAGLTCTEETFMIKAGAQRLAAEYGLMLVAPDTSPRGAGIPGEDDDWDFGAAAGFYLDATELPWSRNYNMYSYVTQELSDIIFGHFPADEARQGIFGHSMGGHGALTIALKNADRFRSVSAFAPIVAPMQVPWGQKAFSGYLGQNQAAWRAYDATELLGEATFPGTILIDQGMDDQFLGAQLRPELFEAAARATGQALQLRRQPGYDHSYYFIQTFIADHLAHHHVALSR